MDSQEELNFGFHTVFIGPAKFLYDQSHHHPSRRCCCWKLASPRKPSFVGHRGMKICRFRTATKIESFVKGITYLSTQNVTWHPGLQMTQLESRTLISSLISPYGFSFQLFPNARHLGLVPNPTHEWEFGYRDPGRIIHLVGSGGVTNLIASQLLLVRKDDMKLSCLGVYFFP